MTRRSSPGAKERFPKESVLVVCEGQNTEPIYLETLKQALNLDGLVEVQVDGNTGHTDPMGLVNDAITLREKRRAVAASSNVVREYDRVWVVFDTEWPGKHPSIPDALIRACANTIEVVVSKPSFEIWYLLHAQPTPPGCARGRDAVKAVRKLHQDLSKYGKHKADATRAATWSLEGERLPTALRHGESQGGAVFDRTHPSLPVATGTSVHRLVQALVRSCDDAPTLKKLGLP